jgi:hypothetical protein
MTLPPIIALKVNCPEGGDLSGLIFEMRITAGTKNLFYICFPKTSADGTTSITAEDFRGQFDDHYEWGLMDYNGTVETAGDLVGILLFDPRPLTKHRAEILRWPLFKHERTVWRSRQERIDYFLSCRNREFYFFEESVRIPANGMIGLTVGRKIGATHDAVWQATRATAALEVTGERAGPGQTQSGSR